MTCKKCGDKSCRKKDKHEKKKPKKEKRTYKKYSADGDSRKWKSLNELPKSSEETKHSLPFSSSSSAIASTSSMLRMLSVPTMGTGSSSSGASTVLKKVKRALIILGPVSGNIGHVRTANKLQKILLSSKYNYQTVNICNGAGGGGGGASSINVRAMYNEFINYIKQDNVQGLLIYIGHGSQFGSYGRSASAGVSASASISTGSERWDYGSIADSTLSTDLSHVGTNSTVIVVGDSCFSDGMIDAPIMAHHEQGTIAFFSAARASGPDDTRSAVFDSEGGYMTHNLCDVLDDLQFNTGSTSSSSSTPDDDLDERIADTSVENIYRLLTINSRYVRVSESMGGNLHIPALRMFGNTSRIVCF